MRIKRRGQNLEKYKTETLKFQVLKQTRQKPNSIKIIFKHFLKNNYKNKPDP